MARQNKINIGKVNLTEFILGLKDELVTIQKTLDSCITNILSNGTISYGIFPSVIKFDTEYKLISPFFDIGINIGNKQTLVINFKDTLQTLIYYNENVNLLKIFVLRKTTPVIQYVKKHDNITLNEFICDLEFYHYIISNYIKRLEQKSSKK